MTYSDPPTPLDFRVLFESAPTAYFVLTPNFTIVAASDAYLQVTRTKREELLGRGLFEVFPDNPNDPTATGVDNLHASIENVLKHRVPHNMAVQKYDIRRPESEGGGFEERYWSAVNIPIFGVNGEITHVLHRTDDVTEFIQLKQQGSEQRRLNQELQTRTEQMAAEIYLRAQELQKANSQLQAVNEALAELDRAKTVFFSNISHEFRTPLSLILAPVEDMLSSRSLSVSEREQLELVHRNSLRLLKLVNNLLDFSRIEAGRMQAVYEPIDLASFTAELASVFRSAVESAGLSFKVDCPKLEQPVYVDREMWEKIVLNLLSNAFKYTFTGEIAVRLQAVSDGREANRLRHRVQLTVCDTGAGISAEELPHLFERFHRVQGARSRTHEGSGIGLALVQELVKLHGGTVDVSSFLNEGTTFTVTIPTGSAHLPSKQLSATSNLQSTAINAAPYVEEAWRWLPEVGTVDITSPQSSAKCSSKSRILLADDNTDLRDYVKRLLSPVYEVEAVADGAAALIAVRERMPDLVLTDVMMPRLDGFELLRELRAEPLTKELPIILLSARAGEESSVEGLETGADDYLIKPFSARELLARVRANLEMSRVRQEAVRRVEAERAFLEAVLQQMPIGVMIAEAPSGKIFLRNEQEAQILRHPFLSVSEIEEYQQYKAFHLDGQPYKLEEYPLVRAILKGEVVTGEEIAYLCGDGIYCTLSVKAAPICDRSGQIIAGVATFYDITERKRTEKALQQLNANLENLVAERTAELQQALKFEAMLKRVTDKVRDNLDEEQILQTAVQELAIVLSLRGCSATLYDLDQDTSSICYEYTTSIPTCQDRAAQVANLPEIFHQLQAGHYFQFCPLNSLPGYCREMILVCPIVDHQDFVVGELWLSNRKNYIFNDLEISLVQQVASQCAIAIRQARLYQAATAQIEELEKLNRLKDDFLSTVSHELRTPMTNMKMAISMLKNSPTGERHQRYLGILQSECSREISLINDLLDLQRLETASDRSQSIEVIDLRATLPNMIEPFRSRIQQQGQILQLNLPQNLPPLISDRASCERILAELLNNACKYTSYGGEIVLSISDSVEPATIFTISNSAEILADQLPRIFDKFYRVPNADPWKQGGTGLGLALVQKLVEQLQGSISVTSGEGWTTFTVQLPTQSGFYGRSRS